jgi:wobble nucleotide-excising tRNase
VPNVPQRWADYTTFETAARDVLARLRESLPGTQEQRTLFERRTALVRLQASLKTVIDNERTHAANKTELDTRHTGPDQALLQLTKLKQHIVASQSRLRQLGGKSALIREALQFLTQCEVHTRQICPLCEQPAQGIRETLQQRWQAHLQSEVAELDAGIRNLEAKRTQLERAQAAYAKLDEQAAALARDRQGCYEELCRLVAANPAPDDDLSAIVGVELDSVTNRLNDVQKRIEEKNGRLREIESRLSNARSVYQLLHLQEKHRLLERLQESPSYHEIEQLRDEIARWAADIAALRTAVAKAAREEAQLKLESAQAAIDRYFRRLSHHPAVQGICLQVQEGRMFRNAYAVTDHQGQDLTPVLSQGDLNALALAIFLGLASIGENEAPFGFVMLDDPSQSLGFEHKRRLVEVLDEAGQGKRLILATMDAEFRDLWNSKLTRGKREYGFGRWTPETGPVILAPEGAR